MTLISHSGSSTTTSKDLIKTDKENKPTGPDVFGIKTAKNVSPEHELDELIANNASAKFELVDPIENMAYDSDYFNNTTFDTINGQNLKNQLSGFLKGIRVTTTYYQLQTGPGNRTHIADNSTERSIINTPTMKIINYEMTLTEQLSTSVDDKGDLSVSGSALLYPRFRPHIGDRFLLDMGDGVIGIFSITSVEVRSYQTDRIHLVNFALYGYANNNEISVMEGQVVSTKVFSKPAFLGGSSTLLEGKTYVELEKVKKYVKILSEHYHSLFFNRGMSTYICNEYNYYDPYLIEFLINTLQFDHVPVKPKQLMLSSGLEFDKSIFGTMLNPSKFGIYGIYMFASIKQYVPNMLSPFVTSLVGTAGYVGLYGMVDNLDGYGDQNQSHSHKCDGVPAYRPYYRYNYNDIENKQFSQHDEDFTCGKKGQTIDNRNNPVTYIFSKDLYTGELDDESSVIEKLVYSTIVTRCNTDTVKLLNILDKFHKLKRVEAFYYIPIYIWLCHVTLNSATKKTGSIFNL